MKNMIFCIGSEAASEWIGCAAAGVENSAQARLRRGVLGLIRTYTDKLQPALPVRCSAGIAAAYFAEDGLKSSATPFMQ
ncbi:hypothetical protein [Rhodomicrobium lacus]|uniref:hypothetical protein n=1 Tax=Rhodomicrobium lacus TaxID=2498452 RepID=UPI000F8D89B4|nr:hypothetical protein [Rhodomicrobium lacus]